MVQVMTVVQWYGVGSKLPYVGTGSVSAQGNVSGVAGLPTNLSDLGSNTEVIKIAVTKKVVFFFFDEVKFILTYKEVAE